MISDKFRYVFFGQMVLKTYRNYFPNHVPTISHLFSSVKTAEISNPSFIKQGKKEVHIKDLEVSNDLISILLEVADPEILDHYVYDTQKNTTRLHARNAHEVPVVSVHVVIDSSSKHDVKKIYPTAIENNPYLPRSYVMNVINSILSRHFNQEKDWKVIKRKMERRMYSPRIDFGAAANQTLDGMLTNGGSLAGVSWVDVTVKNAAQGMGTYAISKTQTVNMKVSGKPKAQDAFGIIRDLIGKVPDGATSTSVIVIDENDKEKVVGVDLTKPDILATVFIPQKKIQLPPNDYLPSHVITLHKNFVQNVNKQLK
ncbi:hypothetical protein [Paracoccus marcusii]|uniref:hypothetical protein n=1 Tax=Paracoccus marcusii TaxID=59779 RepID=UPI0037359B1F